MGNYQISSRLTLCLYLCAGIGPASCGQYAAFMTGFGSQLIVLDSSGNLTYSLCNSGSTPVYPTDSTPALAVATDPRSGSNIAAVGYCEDDVVYVRGPSSVLLVLSKDNNNSYRPTFSDRIAVSLCSMDGTSVIWTTVHITWYHTSHRIRNSRVTPICRKSASLPALLQSGWRQAAKHACSSTI